MKHKLFLPFFVLAAGVAGAFLRGSNLATGYEVGTGLPISGNIYWTVLLVLSVIVAFVTFFLSRQYNRYKGQTFECTFRCASPVYKMISVAAAGVMIACGGYGLYRTVLGWDMPSAQNMLPALPMAALWILTILAGVSIVGVTSAQSRIEISEGNAVYSIIPLFWACFDLFVTYRDNGANPVVSMYAYELLAAIAIMYAFYGLAGFLYSTGNPARFVLFASLAVYLVMVSVGGALYAGIFYGGFGSTDASALLRYISFGACVVFLQSNLFILAGNMNYLDMLDHTAGSGPRE